MRNRKIYHHKDVREIHSHCVSGLPFSAAPFIRSVLEGLLARAQELYPVTISHYTFLPNQFHMILVVKDPQDVSGFLYYFKCRTAHCINKLLGRRGPLWDARYNSPVILDADMLTERLVSHYTSPQRSHLINSITQYPHMTTWGLLDDALSVHTKECDVVSRKKIPTLPAKSSFKPHEIRLYLEQIKDAVWCKSQLHIDPSAAYKVLGCGADDITTQLQALKKQVFQEEDILMEQRKKMQISIRGAHRLVHDRLTMNYPPEVRERRAICLGSDKKMTAQYITAYRHYVEQCRRAYHQ